MANPGKIPYLSKYQMTVLYYKCTEGATHQQIAEILDRDVKTIQYHMTNIYQILEIAAPGKSKEAMDSELKHEICPIIRQMFTSVDNIKTWSPLANSILDEEKEKPAPPYQPPPSLVPILKEAENKPKPPEVLNRPPRRRIRIHWRPVIIGLIVVSIAGVAFRFLWEIIPPSVFPKQHPIATAPQAIISVDPTSLSFTPSFTAPLTRSPTSILTTTPSPEPTSTQTAIPTPFKIITKTSSIDGMALDLVPAGEFKMGCDPANNAGIDCTEFPEEMPLHTVYLGEYWIDQNEVTNAQYARCVDSGSCTMPDHINSITRSSYYTDPLFAKYPVIFVSWSQASAYCAWAGRQLPTEAMWEKAARGPAGLVYPWGNTFDGKKANYCDINCFAGWKDELFDDAYSDTSPVGAYPAGASFYGALDMAGNVYEWVADWFGPYPQGRQENPVGPASGSEHIIRGGSWGDDHRLIRTAVRSHKNVPVSSDFIGFRCAEVQK